MKMQFSYAAFLATTLATLACAQNIADLVQQLPSCALVCLATGAAAGGCALTDFACQCGAARAVITASAGPCIEKGCTGAGDAAKAINITNEICKAAGGSSPAPSVTTAPGYAPAGTSKGQAPASSFASFPPTPTKAAPTVPAQITGNAAHKMNAGVAMAGAAVLAAFAL